MQNGKKLLGSLALLGTMLASQQAFAAGSPTGIWMNDTGRGAIEIKECRGGLCGHVVWVKSADDAGGCGRQIIGNAAPSGANTWDNGWIYSPERKKKYDVELTALDDTRLRVKGYAGTKLFSKTMIWTRAPADLKLCNSGEVAAKAPETKAPETKAPESKASITETKSSEVKTSATAKPTEAPSAKAAPAPAPAEEQQVAENDTDGGFDASEISDKFGDVLTRSADGKCKLDLPWVKLNFECDGK